MEESSSEGAMPAPLLVTWHQGNRPNHKLERPKGAANDVGCRGRARHRRTGVKGNPPGKASPNPPFSTLSPDLSEAVVRTGGNEPGSRSWERERRDEGSRCGVQGEGHDTAGGVWAVGRLLEEMKN